MNNQRYRYRGTVIYVMAHCLVGREGWHYISRLEQSVGRTPPLPEDGAVVSFSPPSRSSAGGGFGPLGDREADQAFLKSSEDETRPQSVPRSRARLSFCVR